jgi:ArsR family transcriptional regulator, arsenate/arsenite/antimonite-responsive transcriptional repressor
VVDDEKMVKVLKALADRTRFRMLREIGAAGALSCGEVGECFDLTQPTISHHLKILVDAGLLVVRRQGQHGIISVNQQLMAQIIDLLPRQLRSKHRNVRSRVDKTPRRSIATRH